VRHSRLRSALAAVVVLVLAGCGSGDDATAPAAAQPSGAFPVTIEHAFGATTIERTPERVVTLGVTDADPVLALGTTPVAVTGYTFFPETGLGPWAQERVQGEQPVLLPAEANLNIEQVAALNPDLIIGVNAGFDQSFYERLSAIAPTLARPADREPYTVPADQATRMIAAALGRVPEGEQLIEATEVAYAAAVAAHPEFQGRTGTVVLPYDQTYGAFFPGDGRGRMMARLGFSLPPQIAELDTGEFYTEVSRERLGMIDGDVLVMLADDPATRAFVDADPVLQTLPVVRRGAMVVPDTDTRGAMTSSSVLSVPYALERLVPMLAEALRR
jgi:iron complex transport system substrate-binding protein